MNREPAGGLGSPPTRFGGYKHRATRCAGCGLYLNATSDPKRRGMPRPGDLTICVRCGTILRFDSFLHLVTVTPAELEQLPSSSHEELKEQQGRYRAYHGKKIISVPKR